MAKKSSSKNNQNNTKTRTNASVGSIIKPAQHNTKQYNTSSKTKIKPKNAPVRSKSAYTIEQAKRDRKKATKRHALVGITSLILVIVVAIVGTVLVKSAKNKTPDGPSIVLPSFPNVLPLTIYDGFGWEFGKKNAPVQMLVYTSWECSDCAKFATTFDGEIQKLIDNGTLKITIKPMHLDMFKYDNVINYRFKPKKYSDIANMFANKFSSYSEYVVSDINKAKTIKALGLPQKEDKTLKIMTRNIMEEVHRNNIQHTPTVFINGYSWQEPQWTVQQFDDLVQGAKVSCEQDKTCNK